ncbi:prolyl 4-hydroxylase subunit alpha [Thiomicrorhabdus immobilis]|uniref:Prolyl 4-hydroxylase subunit alpha n=1 Tax=Thiomicrorhabdus immobilis TaxID=2791037 RepID=A0ABN6CUA2_9GAMM|nr:2OG-Fe(II) oxygenase [Thiomicrorhabdus immobilis]BCN92541.1 prolyl 4-hydroxylase subunit alpha [Thiomicrorhabdus immobilis]
MNLTPETLNLLLDNLVEHGWYALADAIPMQMCAELLSDIERYDEAGALKPAGIGRGDEHQIAKEIRRDQIKWLDGSSEVQRQYLQYMAQLQYELNKALFLGLFEYECHYALYQQGDFYKKHLDSFKGQANRMVSSVLYLNPDWQPDWGGELVIYNEEDNAEIARVLPEMGKLVVFMSEQMPHEVLPTLQPRASVTGWFRCNNSTAMLADPAR